MPPPYSDNPLRSDISLLASEYLANSKDSNLKKRLSSQLVALLQVSCAPGGRSPNTSADPELQLTQLFYLLVKRVLPNPKKSNSTSFTSADLKSFLCESICILADEQINIRVSELLADTIWSIESEIEAQRSGLEEQIQSLNTEPPRLVPGSTEVDNLTDAPQQPNIHLTMRKAKLESLSRSRTALIQLAIALLQSDEKNFVALQPTHCRLSWEYGFLYETGLIPFPADLVAKQATRLNTGLHYKQQRFNLLREESEGYSHLATELISAMGPGLVPHLVPADSGQGNLTNYPHLRSILLPGETPQTRDSRIEKVSNNIKAMIGFFDLDPNRTLDIILDVFCYNVISHHPFFCSLLKKSHWMQTVDCNSTVDDDPILPADGTLPSEQGSKLIASLLGFKYAHYQQSDTVDSTPDELHLMTAVLIWHKIVKLRDILPHLSPDLQTIKEHESNWRQEVMTKALNAGPQNALSMAGALDNSGLMGPYSKMNTSSKIPDGTSATTSTQSKSLPNQKAGLLSALLSIGAIHESIFMLSIPNHQYLAHQDPNISALLLRLIDVALDPAYRKCELSVQKSGDASQSTLTRPKKRYAGGPNHLLVDAEVPKSALSARVTPRAAILSATSLKTEPVFFWPAWRDRILRANDNVDFLNHVWPMLRFVGPFGHMHMGVFHKVATLTAAAVQTPSNEARGDPRWNYILRWFLLPGLCMTQGCVAASNVIWKVLQSYSYEERYMMYGEWKDRIYQRIPELKVERVKADAETKRVLKTMTLDNLREKSRALAKLASSNPCIVFNAALNQVQTYDNLIACVIECLRYLNLFALDVLTYSIVEFLSNPDKDRSKSDGTNIAAWLQNLAKFVGNVFKRNLSLDPAIVLQYIANQLATGNAKDLIILRDMISKMAGVDVLQDLSASQVVALGGSKTLRAEAISPTSLTAKKPSFSKSSNRLMKALTESGLTVPLLLLVTLQRQNAVLLADDGAHLKYLGVLADSCQQVLFQYIEFLRMQLTSRSISDYENAMPPMELMWEQYRNDPAIVFQVWRPILSASVRPALKIGADGEVIVDETLSPAALPPSTMEECVDPTTQDDNPQLNDKANQPSSDQPHYPSSLLPTVSLAERILPEQTRKLVGPHFFVTFWQLELYDIRMPDDRYISETNRLNVMLSDLDRDYATPMISSMKEVNRANRSKILEIRATLTKEMKIHIKHYELTRARLASEKSFWFPLSARSPFRAQLLEHIIQHCFNPRAKISPVDAAYTAQFIKTLHGLGTASFMTLKLLDRIFSSDVGPSIFPCSEFEASNYGRFLKDLLLLVKSWYDSESTFKKTGLGKDKRGNYLPGLRMKWVKSDNATEAIAESDMLSYENLQKVVKKWTSIMSTVCREAIQSGEYMYIRNSIAVLKELDGLVPLFEDQAISLEASVTELLKREKREDVRVLAYGYQSMLKRAVKTVIKVNPTHVPKPDATALPLANTGGKPIGEAAKPVLTVPTKPINPLSSNPVAPPLPPSKPAVPISLPDSRPVLSPVLPTSRPAGLPERPPSTATRLLPSVSRHEGDRKLPGVPLRQINSGPYRNGADSDHQALAVDAPKSLFPSAPPVPSAEAAEREALARAAVQRSRKFAATNATPSSFPSPDPSHPKSAGQRKEEPPRHPTNNLPHSADRPQAPSSQTRPAEPATRLYNLTPSGPKATRPTNTPPGTNRDEELMRPPALPSAPRADSIRRDNASQNNLGTHQHLPSHPSSHVSTSTTASPRTRDDLTKRPNDDNSSHRSRDERDSFDRRDERDHRRLRDEPPRTRPPSVESLRSIRSGRDKEKRADRSDRSEKRKRSRSPSDRHRDHRERDRERDRDRDRDRERERERDKEREKDRDRDRKDRDLRHREKEKDAGREERDREKRSHRRDRDRDDRRHEKERDKDRERERSSNQASQGHPEPRQDLELGHIVNGDDRNPKDSNTDLKSTAFPYNGAIPSGPRALQPPNMSPRTMRTLPTGPASSFPSGRPDNSRAKYPSSSTDAANAHTPQNGQSTRNGSGQSHGRSHNGGGESHEPIEVADGPNSTDRVSRESHSRENPSSEGLPSKAAMPPTNRQSGDSWSPHRPLQGSKNMEPKKNLSIRGMAGMAANALQKANEDNARKDRRESIEVIVAGNRALPIDLDGAIPKKRDFDRDSTGNNLATTPTSLLSRMDDGKVTQEDSATKRKKEDNDGRDGDVIERDGHGSRRTSMRESSKQDELRNAGNTRASTDGNHSAPKGDHHDRISRLGGRNSHTSGRGGDDRDRNEKGNDSGGRRKERERGNSRERPKRHGRR
ncbi:hypothetical protein PCANC_25777 [Puccinia coronata f. sp. avenae]|uniref:THO complex subunit 2 n=1 Tax=Puccinia coronata f. sp. avenae TaxID=200324 RepID=A0A2N5S9N1_9BASI|nr:hypothetical protein PCANC_25777 [Puccinia coronata f. sp. avenae]